MATLSNAYEIEQLALLAKFASKPRAARRAAGPSQEELADAAKLHRTEISLLERWQRQPRLRTLLVLGDALDIEIGT
jgi:transcriptional regulator with XRE-family HTH domain